MSVSVEFLGPIDKENIVLNVSSLNELKSELHNIKEVKQWLDKSAVAVNDVIVKDLSMPLNDGDKISILPPVCGG